MLIINFHYWFWSQIQRLHSIPLQKQKLGPSHLKVQKPEGKNSSLPKCSNCTILISLCSSYHLISLAIAGYCIKLHLRPMAGKGGLINHLMKTFFFLFNSQGKNHSSIFFPKSFHSSDSFIKSLTSSYRIVWTVNERREAHSLNKKID